MLKIEHFACDVADPVAMVAWYVEHLGMRVLRRLETVVDAAGRGVIELYSNPADPVPDYAAQHPLRFHVAFATDDPDGAKGALVSAGATLVDEQTLADGSRLVMLRDPWGLPLQLCKRNPPLMPGS